MPHDFGAEVRIVLVMFSMEALSQATLWLRLIEADLPSAKPELILDGALSAAELEAVLPPSQHGRITVEHSLEWGTNEPNRVLAMVVQDRSARILMIGAPTEDAWDEFRAAATLDI